MTQDPARYRVLRARESRISGGHGGALRARRLRVSARIRSSNGNPNVRFLCRAPCARRKLLRARHSSGSYTVCRLAFGLTSFEALKALSRLVVNELELRRHVCESSQAFASAGCGKKKDELDQLVNLFVVRSFLYRGISTDISNAHLRWERRWEFPGELLFAVPPP